MRRISLRLIIGFIGGFIAPGSLLAQISSPEILLEGYGDILDIDIQDFNNDGLEDILIAYIPSFENARFGLFLYTAYQEGEKLKHRSEKIADVRAHELWIADLNGDGWKDLIVNGTYTQNIPGGELLTFINTNGELQKVDNDLSFFTTENRSLERIYDINADGYDDLIYHQRGDPTFYDTLKMAINLDGHFDEIHTIAPEPGQYKIGDLNGDGLPDLVFEEFISGQPPVQTLYSLINQGNLTFQWQLLDTSFASSKSIFLIGDINGDQTNEPVIKDSKNDVLYAIYNIGSPDSIWHDTLTHDFSYGHMYDFDFDNDLDIHYAGSDTTQIILNDGNGNYTTPLLYQDLPPSNPKGTFHANEELLPRHYFGDYTLYLYYYSNLSYQTEKFRHAQYQLGSLDDIEIFDINEDGYLDIVFASRFVDLVAYFPGLPNKNFGQVVPIINDELGAKTFSIADFNKDGKPDLNVTGIWSNQNSIFYGEGGGNFGEKQTLFEDLGFTRGEAVGDFESDGFPDIIVGKYGSNALQFRRNHEGTFEEKEFIQLQFDPIKLHARDVDFDGDEDLIYQTTGMLRWLENENGNLGSEQFLAGAVISDYFFIDMDKDGKDEILSADEDHIFITKWNGESYERWKTVLGNETNSFAHFVPFDYNGDGYVDLIVQLTLDAHRLFQNINNESFEFDGMLQERFDFPLDGMHSNLDHVMDIDGDGDYDWMFDWDRNIIKVSDLMGEESLQGNVYWDENLDSLRNSEELVVPNTRITAFNGLDEEFYAFSDDFGNFKFFLEPNDYILFATPPNECWQTLAPEQLLVDYSGGTPINSIYFRMENLGSDKPVFSASITRQPTRCGFTVRYFVTLSNDGCRTFDGTAKFELDTRVQSYSNISLSEYTLEGNTINLNVQELGPGQKLRFDFLVQVPGVEFLGEEMTDQIQVFDDISNETVYSNSFYSEITCAYDPNDKLASPDRRRTYGEAYILDEKMTYTIRFQNTGTDTAFNIRLADTLSELLDISTFRPVDASHDYSVLLNAQERTLQVFFEDILLPDSNVNYIGSNGFFTFEIKPVEMLPEFTPITNQAAIYFDFNPPIITNLVKNTYVSDLSLVTSTKYIDTSSIDLFPNPTNGHVFIESEHPIQHISVLDAAGAKLPFRSMNGLSQIEIKANGICFIKIQTHQSTITKKVVIQNE